jgi:periplasmic divalent cation tolerance protein
MIYIFWTSASLEEARHVSRQLLQQRLVACANLFAGVESLYLWQGQVEEAQEVKVILKTKGELFEKVREFIALRASYQVPEISSLFVDEANPSYLRWLEQELSKS